MPSAYQVEESIAAQQLLGDPDSFVERNFDQALNNRIPGTELSGSRLDPQARLAVAHELAVNYLKTQALEATPNAQLNEPIVLRQGPGGPSLNPRLVLGDVDFKVGLKSPSGDVSTVLDLRVDRKFISFKVDASAAEIRTEIRLLVRRMVEQVGRRLVHLVSDPVLGGILPEGELKTQLLAAATELVTAELAEQATVRAGGLPTNWTNGHGSGGELGAEFARIPRTSALYDILRRRGTAANIETEVENRRRLGGASVTAQDVLLERLNTAKVELGSSPVEVAMVERLIDVVRRTGRVGR